MTFILRAHVHTGYMYAVDQYLGAPVLHLIEQTVLWNMLTPINSQESRLVSTFGIINSMSTSQQKAPQLPYQTLPETKQGPYAEVYLRIRLVQHVLQECPLAQEFGLDKHRRSELLKGCHELLKGYSSEKRATE